jgi:hypothetical protein
MYNAAWPREFERTLAEGIARLQESEQRFARFMRHLPGLAWTKDCKAASGRAVCFLSRFG